MERIALITCGESAKTSWNDGKSSEYDRVVGVNWASHWYHLDWLVSCDLLVWRVDGFRKPTVGACYAGEFPEDMAEQTEGLELWDIRPYIEGCTMSFPHALRFCLERWPEGHVDVYGLDMDKWKGLAKFWNPNSHGSQRWDQREIPFIKPLVEKHYRRVRIVGTQLDLARIASDEIISYWNGANANGLQ